MANKSNVRGVSKEQREMEKSQNRYKIDGR